MKKITVRKIISSRYGSKSGRPSDWDSRVSGTDTIETTEGEIIALSSSGQQSVPEPGWVLMLLDGNNPSVKEWTLFGMPSHTTSNIQ